MSSSEVSVINNQPGEEEEEQLDLPPGFRFHPTDEEVVSHYLTPKVLNRRFSCAVIADVDLNKCEPWDLPAKAKQAKQQTNVNKQAAEWYFFCHKDRKYPTGTRTNRATATGYWKATGKDREIFRGGDGGVLVGMKKTLVFYLGRAPRGEKTPWVMHEFRLEGKLPPNLPRTTAKDEWAVCRVFNKDLAAKQPATTTSGGSAHHQAASSSSTAAGFLDTIDLPPLMDSPFADDDIFGGFPGAMAAGMSTSGYYQVKAEQQHPSYSYFSLPAATNNNPGGVHCKQPGEADADVMRPLYPELDDDLLCQDGFMDDYSNMWKF